MKNIFFIDEQYSKNIDLETERRSVAGGLIFKNFNTDKGKLLIIQRAKDDHWPNFWEIPRGKVEEGENLKQGLLREVKEETGLDIVPLRYFNKFNYIVENNGVVERFTTQYNFICKMKNEDDEIKLSHEHQDYKWISYDAEAELYLNDEIKKTVMMALTEFGNFKINSSYDYKPVTDNINEADFFLASNYKNIL